MKKFREIEVLKASAVKMVFGTCKFWHFCGNLRSDSLNKSYRGGFGLFESIITCRTSGDAQDLLATEHGQV